MLANTIAINKITQPGKLGKAGCKILMSDQLHKAPIIKTSPCAKLIKLMMP